MLTHISQFTISTEYSWGWWECHGSGGKGSELSQFSRRGTQMSQLNLMTIHQMVVETFHSESQMTTLWWREGKSRRIANDSSSGHQENICITKSFINISVVEWQTIGTLKAWLEKVQYNAYLLTFFKIKMKVKRIVVNLCWIPKAVNTPKMSSSDTIYKWRMIQSYIKPVSNLNRIRHVVTLHLGALICCFNSLLWSEAFRQMIHLAAGISSVHFKQKSVCDVHHRCLVKRSWSQSMYQFIPNVLDGWKSGLYSGCSTGNISCVCVCA